MQRLLLLLAALPTLLATSIFTIEATRREAAPSCPGVPAPPSEPFRVIWNHPDRCAHRRPSYLSRQLLEHFGIESNTRRRFLGDKVLTLYKTGPWPEYKDGHAVNGGLPQLYNDTKYTALRAHLAELNLHDFRGLGVLDWEAWRALFATNWGKMTIYRKESKNYAHTLNPGIAGGSLKDEAQTEWEEAAQKIMSGKLAAAQEEMPDGQWGYYLYPRTWGKDTVAKNDRLAWLWRQSTGLYPSVYLYETRDEKLSYVGETVGEAVRVQGKYSPPNTPVFAYTSFLHMHMSTKFIDKATLAAVLWEEANRGASGSIMWAGSAVYRHKGQCERTERYLTSTLGPLVVEVKEFMAQCSAQVCGGHGRCIHNAKDTLVTEADAIQSSSSCVSRDSRFHDYHCRCYAQWQGDCCMEASPCLK